MGVSAKLSASTDLIPGKEVPPSRMGEHQSQSGYGSEERNLCPYQKSNPQPRSPLNEKPARI